MTIHHTVVPLFTDVAGTVRLDCTLPEDDGVLSMIPREDYVGMIRY